MLVRDWDLEALLHDDTLFKALSTIYKQLFTDTSKVPMSCRNVWSIDFPQMDGDNWYDMWDAPFTRLVSARYHLTQYKILHSVYLTPARLAKFSLLRPLPTGVALPCMLTLYVYFGLRVYPTILVRCRAKCSGGHDNTYSAFSCNLSTRPSGFLTSKEGETVPTLLSLLNIC